MTAKKVKDEPKPFAGLVVDTADMCLLELDYKIYVVSHAFALSVFRALNAAPTVSRDYNADTGGYDYAIERRYASEKGSVAKLEPIAYAQLAQAVMAYNPEGS